MIRQEACDCLDQIKKTARRTAMLRGYSEPSIQGYVEGVVEATLISMLEDIGQTPPWLERFTEEARRETGTDVPITGGSAGASWSHATVFEHAQTRF